MQEVSPAGGAQSHIVWEAVPRKAGDPLTNRTGCEAAMDGGGPSHKQRGIANLCRRTLLRVEPSPTLCGRQPYVV